MTRNASQNWEDANYDAAKVFRHIDVVTRVCSYLIQKWQEWLTTCGIRCSPSLKHGHCEVPTNYAENKKLGIWVANQRKAHRNGKLSAARLLILESIGFQWRILGVRERTLRRSWEQMYQRLAKVFVEYGHSNVPYFWDEIPVLVDGFKSSETREHRATLGGANLPTR